MVVIKESGMQFGEYDEKDVFYIEKSDQYQKKLMPHGVKSCEFILKKDKALYFVEAKTTCPNEITASTPDEKARKYHEYIEDITDKMRDSLALYASILLRRYEMAGIPDALLSPDLSEQRIKLVLVVKNAEDVWLIPLKDKLNKALRHDSRIWKFEEIYVINERRAREKNFVI